MSQLWNLGLGKVPLNGTPQPEEDVAVEVIEAAVPDDSSIIVNEDGSVTVDTSPVSDGYVAKGHFANLAEGMSSIDLSSLANGLIELIEQDDASRSEWLATRAAGIDLLGLKLESAKGDVGSTNAPVEGMSTVRHPILIEAVLTAWSNARGELLPASGPVKVSDSGRRSADRDQLCEALEKDFNFFLTKKAREYYPDTDRLLLMTAFGGSGFKKVYRDPMRRRPVSESIDAQDLIVNNAATDLRNSGRVTHRFRMRQSVMKRMKHLGIYRDVSLIPPTEDPSVVDIKQASVEGIAIQGRDEEDREYNLYECYCELDLDQFAPPSLKGSGLLLPFRVTIDKDSQEILELSRNWDEDDEDCEPRTTFVHYPYIRGFGLYGWGLLHLLGNSAQALTAAWREALDAGMFANFPGFLIAKLAARQQTNEMRVAAGSGQVVDTQGMDISKAVMPLPYKDVTPGLLGMIDKVQQSAQRVGAIGEVKVGEGKQDAPVGTTIALIEQATKIESAIHKNLFQAQSEEFELLADLFREDPESFWRGNKRPATQWDKDKFLQALDTYGITPQADPNTPSHLHRVMKAVALKQLQKENPALYDSRKVDSLVLSIMGFDDPQSLFAPPQVPGAPPIDPRLEKVKVDAASKHDELQMRAKMKEVDIVEAEKDRDAKRQLALLDLARTLAVHPEAESIVDRTINPEGSIQ